MGKEKDYGEPINYDPTFNGPTHNRSCTDIVWLILFILFLGLWGYVAYYSMTHGNVQQLLAPMDSGGLHCGFDSGVADKKYLVFFDLTKCLSAATPIVGCATHQVCVKQCPTTTHLFELEMNAANFEQHKQHLVCMYDIVVDSLDYITAKRYIDEGKCANYVLKSQSVLERCLPDTSELVDKMHEIAVNLTGLTETQIASQVADLVRFNQLSSQIVSDLVQSRWYLAGALAGVVVLCFLYILLLRWVVGPLVWLSIAGLLALLAFATYLCYNNYVYYRAHPVTPMATTNVVGKLRSLLTMKETWMGLVILVAVVLVVLLLIVIFLRARITIAIALIREGSKAVTAIKSTVLFPIFPWILQCVVIAFGVVVFMYILSIGDRMFKVINLKNDSLCICSPQSVYSAREDYVSCDPLAFNMECRNAAGGPCPQANCHFTGLDSPHSTVYLHLVNLLGFFWTMFFISGVSDMILASTFSSWYWTFHKRDLPFFTLTRGIFRTLWYHLGTVALGALIIAIVRVIRVILEVIDRKLKKYDNPFTRCVLCCCKCFFWCLENFLKFINKNAYIMCAVHGGNFCKSARDAFSLLMRNIVRVAVLDKVTDLIFFLSKLLMSIGVGFAVYYLLQWSVVYEVTSSERLNFNYVPAVILSVATYLICTLFFNVYAMAVDTLFLCFLEDCERNDGSPEKPYFMSKNLMKILGKKNKQF